jgi:purine nucleoside permease
VSLLTDGKGSYCTTQQEDNAVYEALKRAAAEGMLDINRLAVLRVAANFDRPYPGETADASLHTSSGGFPIACENIYRAAAPVVREIIDQWEQWESGVP